MLAELLSEVRFRLRAIFRRGAMERELDAELRFHLDREIEKLMRGGLSHANARRTAALAFGGLDRIKDDTRDAHGVSYADVTVQTIRYSVRGLRNTPGFTLAVVLTLALGIGVNAAMFDVVDRLMYRPPAFLRDPSGVHKVYFLWSDRRGEYAGFDVEYTRFLDVVKLTHSFGQIGGFRRTHLSVGDGAETQTLPVGVATASFFEMFNAAPAIGRYFTRREDSVTVESPVAVISYPYWQLQFGGRGDVLGTRLRVGSAIYTIIGVTPPGFTGVDNDRPPVVWLASTAYAGTIGFLRPGEYYQRYNWSWIELIVRTKPGVSEQVATADLSNAFQRSWNFQAAFDQRNPPASIARPHATLQPLQRWRSPGVRTEGRIMGWIIGVAAIVLVIACANVANLQLARALSRGREIAIRLALGVSRPRLFGQLMAESILLSIAGGILGAIMVPLGSRLLQQLFVPGEAVSANSGSARTVFFVGAIAVVTGLVAGLAPALHAIRARNGLSLHASRRGGGSPERSRVRVGLVMLQTALSAVLLIGAGLFVRSLANVRSLRVGYDVDPIVYISWDTRGARLDSATRAALGLRLQSAALATPGVTSATRIVTAPFDMRSIEDLFVPGVDSVARLGQFTMQAASSEFFATVGTRIVRGRALTADDGVNAPRVAVVSESMARALWPDRDALGQCMRIRSRTAECTTVVGVAEDSKQYDFTADRVLHYYLPIDQYWRPNRGLFLRVRGDAAQFTEALRRRLQAETPGPTFVIAIPMRDLIDPSMRSWKVGATTFLAFGALALVVATLGLYSVVSYHVAQRRHELGVRIALGAQVRDLIRLVLGEGVRMGVGGVVAGVSVVLAAGKWVAPLLYRVEPRDPSVMLGVVVLLIVVAVLASAVPAWRASRVDANLALRAD